MASWLSIFTAITGISAGIMIIKRLFNRHVIYKSHILMTGKTVLITGANVGIGKSTALDMARRQARVILACRDVNKANEAVKYIRKFTQEGTLIVKHIDLASLKSVRKFCEEIYEEEPRLDVLINNAGIFRCPYSKTEDGFEMQMGVNHFGHFLLTNLLLDLLKTSAPSRIVIVSSALHKNGKINFEDINSEKQYSRVKGYADSKLANVLFAQELSKKLQSTKVNVYCLHPGVVKTKLGRHVVSPIVAWLLAPLMYLVLKTPDEGCMTTVYCCVEPELSKDTGLYYGNCQAEPLSQTASDVESAKKLYDISEKVTAFSIKKSL